MYIDVCIVYGLPRGMQEYLLYRQRMIHRSLACCLSLASYSYFPGLHCCSDDQGGHSPAPAVAIDTDGPLVSGRRYMTPLLATVRQ